MDAFAGLLSATDRLQTQHTKTYDRLLATVDDLIGDLEATVATLSGGMGSEGAMEVDSGEGAGGVTAAAAAAAMEGLQQRLSKKDYAKAAASVRKPFRTANVKLQKAIEHDLSALPPSPKEWTAEAALVDEAIAKHLTRMGRFEEAQAVLADSDTMDLDTDEEAFKEVSSLEGLIAAGNVDKALAWAEQHQAQLDELGTGLHFRLHQFKLIQVLKKDASNKLAAVAYARKNFGPFLGEQKKEIQRTMTMLIFLSANRNPYEDLLDASFPKRLAAQFRRDYCNIHNLPERSALLTTTMAGSLALPALEKMAKLSKGHWSEIFQRFSSRGQCIHGGSFQGPIRCREGNARV